ncbi:MAG: hypothetical protein LBU62_03210 [Bacteroidales bacterium]|nr:hypothetical protein [Bacteroidales bacterium]
MKKFASILLCMSVFMTLNIQAQGDHQHRKGPGPMNEQIKAERVAFFTDKIGLTVDEAQSFWALYNEMDKKKMDLFEEKAGIMHRFTKDGEAPQEKEAGKLLDRLVVINKQEAELYSEYDARFRKILSNEKVIKMYVAEFQFRNVLLQKMRGKRPENK